MKVPLTVRQKAAFEKEFKKIISDSNSTTAKNLLKKNGKLDWVMDVPLTGDIIETLDSKSISDYIKLMVKINDRTI